MTEENQSRSNFIREIVEADLAADTHGGRVVTRFPPEPNGYLHIGHAKSICLNFGIARDYNGQCHLRFDDTNPTAEDDEFVQSIQADVRWLGFDWGEHLYFASDYFEQMYAWAQDLIRAGLAYVDSSSLEEVRELRGDFTTPGRPSPYRERSVEENLDLFERMRAGEFPDGAHTLRAKIDMAHPNMIMRDPLLYRIKHAHHHRQGDGWCIYPMYDYAHCLEDAIEHITHSVCTLEFENNREIYDWLIDHVDVPSRPRQYEFARLNLAYTVMSKRKLAQLVRDGHVSGWDDPRMPTVAGLRRRGVTPEAIHAFAEMIGVAKANSFVDIGKLEHAIRDDLNTRAPRRLAVIAPLEVVLTNESGSGSFDAPSFPDDVGGEGSRAVPYSSRLWIDADDFAHEPPQGWKRLSPGAAVRLRYGPVIRCDDVVLGDSGEVVRLECSVVDDETPVRGAIHWVDADAALPAEFRLYDRLFTDERPDGHAGRDFLEFLNPDSLSVAHGYVEPAVRDDAAGSHYQFERVGYFISDGIDSAADGLVFNRVIGLRDSWAKLTGTVDPQEEIERRVAEKARMKAQSARRPDAPVETDRDRARASDPRLAARYAAYVAADGLSDDDADLIASSHALADFFDAAVARYDAPSAVAKWAVNELLHEMKDASLESLAITPTAFGELVELVETDVVSATAGKEVLARLVADGGAAVDWVDTLGLRQMDDTSALSAVIAEVLKSHPEEVERYREGKTALIGFFVGQAMRASQGRANPALVKDLMARALEH